MSKAEDYKICCNLFNAYIARVGKRHTNFMLADRREITEEEIMMLIDWYLDRELDDCYTDISFISKKRNGMRVQMKFVKDE